MFARRVLQRGVSLVGGRSLSSLAPPPPVFEEVVVSESFGRELRCDVLGGADAGIAVLSLDRSRAKNALGMVLMDEFRGALDRIRFDREIRAVVVQSVVDGVFCAGADLKERAEMSESEVGSFVAGLRGGFDLLAALPQPTVACIDGFALGGGLELAMACDLRVAGPKAVMGLVEANLAIIPGAGGTQRLPRLVGAARAKELIFTARRLNPEEALSIGLIQYAIPESRLESESETESATESESESINTNNNINNINNNTTPTSTSSSFSATACFPWARSLARETLGKGPVALRMAKIAVDRGMDAALPLGMVVEQQCYAQVIPTKDRLEGLTAFREKRKPVYKGE